ncbi:MAG TPA: MDR family oxidoreductase [Acidimicrobiia bacterium]|nr:MDR family oxidoreductase [Acidimicrobiia bacterium]
MNETFRALVAGHDQSPPVVTRLTDADLPDGDVTVAVAYSSLNYKDGLTVTGSLPLIQRYPMVCGIDLAGTVETSDSPAFRPGDRVLVNGYGLAETHWGGYTQRQRLRAEWLVPVPDAFTLQEAMVIGTAGYTAMLCVMALEDAGLVPDAGEVIVTGAGGGVGSVSVTLLALLGYRVAASTGRPELEPHLRSIGANRVLRRAELARTATEPLEEEMWTGAIDTVAGETLATVLRQLRYGGAVAAPGVAGSFKLTVSMFPFVVRGVRLLGVDCVQCPMPRRLEAWRRLARDLPAEALAPLASVEPLDNVPKLAEAIVAGKIRGRVVIDVNA